MKPVKILLLFTFLLQSFAYCKSPKSTPLEISTIEDMVILPAADQPEVYLPLLRNKKVGLVVNQTSVLTQKNNIHLVDYLMMEGIEVVKVFVPEHGFRGDADAGEVINNEVDKRTGLPIVSLYGNQKKPSKQSLADIDVLIYDLQDVGVRFYTYISTLHYVMEGCAEAKKQLLLLDRPNPNGNYIAGPVLKKGFESFVGMHPIPVVHGLTVGELAQMINGEGWLSSGITCELEIIPVKNWSHDKPYGLPIKPSPNLPNDLSIKLYPSLCFFEGTDVSVGRGTYYPFQVYGYPDAEYGTFTFTPVSISGMSKTPPHQDKLCYGKDLRNNSLTHEFTLDFLLDAYKVSGKKEKFFNNFFDKLAGTDQLRKDIIAGKTSGEIVLSWQNDLKNYKIMREKYKIY
jgi:uncharacterized protein YbbC (DUF1343 family)